MDDEALPTEPDYVTSIWIRDEQAKHEEQRSRVKKELHLFESLLAYCDMSSVFRHQGSGFSSHQGHSNSGLSGFLFLFIP